MNVIDQEDCHMARKLAHNSKIPAQSCGYWEPAASQSPVALVRRTCNICTANLSHPEETEIIQY